MTNKSSYHNLTPIVGQGSARCLLSSILNLYEAQLNYINDVRVSLQSAEYFPTLKTTSIE